MESRPYAPSDLPEVLDLFTEPDFCFRTELPHLLAESEVAALTRADTHLILADGALLGLYGVDPVGNRHGCHFRLHLRLRAGQPVTRWVSAYREIVAALRWRTEVVRLSLQVGEHDERGIAVAAALGLTAEGALPGVATGVFFAEVWPVAA